MTGRHLPANWEIVEPTVDVDHKGHVRGTLALQYGAGTVRFRNIKIRTR